MKANTLSMKKEIKGNTVEGTSRVMYQRGFNDALRLVSEKVESLKDFKTQPLMTLDQMGAHKRAVELVVSLLHSLQEEGKTL